MKFSMFYLPAIGGEEVLRQKGRLAGQDRELYQQMLQDLLEQVQYIDKKGFDAVCFTEHHFHVEGYEVSTNPIMLDLFMGLQTERIKVGQLGNVLPTHNPIRLAENIAMLDQMTKGRAFAAFARGYQHRWVRTIGQRNNVGISNNESTEDERNREVFEEYFEIIQKAWKGGTFKHDGEYKIPIPVDYGYKTNQEGLNEDGILEEVGIAPLPYQKELDLWHPFSFSESTIRWCAERGAQPIVMTTNPKTVNHLFDVYHEVANKSGYDRERGDRIVLIRDVFVYDTEEEAKHWQSKGAGVIWKDWFAPDGFNMCNLREGETVDQLTGEYDELVERGFCIVGTPEQVREQIQQLKDETGVKHLMFFNFSTAVPHDKMMRSLELFTTEVMPHFAEDEVTIAQR